MTMRKFILMPLFLACFVSCAKKIDPLFCIEIEKASSIETSKLRSSLLTLSAKSDIEIRDQSDQMPARTHAALHVGMRKGLAEVTVSTAGGQAPPQACVYGKPEDQNVHLLSSVVVSAIKEAESGYSIDAREGFENLPLPLKIFIKNEGTVKANEKQKNDEPKK